MMFQVSADKKFILMAYNIQHVSNMNRKNIKSHFHVTCQLEKTMISLLFSLLFPSPCRIISQLWFWQNPLMMHCLLYVNMIYNVTNLITIKNLYALLIIMQLLQKDNQKCYFNILLSRGRYHNNLMHF